MSDKLFATIATIVSILAVIISILLISNLRNSDKQSIHYISKRGEAIAVSIASPNKKISHTKAKVKQHKKAYKKIHHKRKKRLHNKTITRKVVKKHQTIKHKTKKNITTEHKHPPTPIEAKKLFSSIKMNNSSQKYIKHKKEGEGSGVLNRYLASIEKRLRGWPAQSNFAGEEIDVRLKIYPNGQFDYKVMRYSDNQAFNDALISYLEQLKQYGFDPHGGNRAYEIEVKFIAHQ